MGVATLIVAKNDDVQITMHVTYLLPLDLIQLCDFTFRHCSWVHLRAPIRSQGQYRVYQ